MPPYNMPGILDNPFMSRTPNIGPAGSELFGGKNPPSIVGPPPAPIRPLNTAWIDPGILLEPPTGFGGEGASSAIQQNVGMPGFMMPEWMFGMPPFPPPPGPGEPQGQEEDFLGGAMKAGAKFLESLAKQGGGSTQTFFGPDVVQEGMKQQWGFDPEPKFDLGGESAPGFGTGPENDLFPTFTGVTPEGANSAIRNFYGFPGEAPFSIMGDEVLPTLSADQFSLGASLSGGAGLPAQAWAGPVGAAAAAAPFLSKMLTDDPKINSAVGLGSGLAGTAAAIGAGGILGPATGVLAAPFAIGLPLNAVLRANNLYGHAGVPHGFYDTGGGVYANPETGVTIQRDGRYNWKPTEQSSNRQAITPEQARAWGLPIPGVDIGFNDLNKNALNQFSQASSSGYSYLRPDLIEALTRGGGADDLMVGLNDLLEAKNPGRTQWTPHINRIKQQTPGLSEGEIWRRWTISPEGQAELARQQQYNDNRNDR